MEIKEYVDQKIVFSFALAMLLYDWIKPRFEGIMNPAQPAQPAQPAPTSKSREMSVADFRNAIRKAKAAKRLAERVIGNTEKKVGIAERSLPEQTEKKGV